MNHFANSLFTMLFGWSRTIIQHVWSSSASGHFNGFFTWLGDHWVFLAVGLALAGTAADLLVWLFRWQPYLVWKTRLRQLDRWVRGNQTAPNRRFEKGYKGGVALDMQQDDAPKEPASQVEWQEPMWPQEPPDNTHSFTEQLIYDENFSGAVPERQGRARQDDQEGYEPPPMVTASWLSGAYQKKTSAPVRRKRRSEKNVSSKPAWTNKLMIREVEEDSLLDSLPPAVDRKKAFHDPVYPMQNYTGADTGWQPPEAGQPAEGSYRK